VINAFVLIDVEPAHIAGVAEQIAAVDGVSSAHSVAGGVADVIAVLRVPDHDGIARVVTEHIVQMEGVTSTRTAIAFRSYAPAELDAAFEGFGD
jgi:DNA-binding Lrp family transcriptional regulator